MVSTRSNAREAAYLAFTAGVTVDLVSCAFLNHLEALVAEGRITADEVTARCRLVLEAKARLGLFDDPYLGLSEGSRAMRRPRHVTLAREAGLATGAPPDARRGHVGFHLVGPGQQALEQAAGVGLPPLLALQRRARRAPLLLYRLFYACDLRYGVVTDITHKVLHGIPVSLETAFVNVIWQGDANRLALRALTQAAVPAADETVALNVTGPVVAVRDIAERVGMIAGVAPVFTGTPSDDALLANIDRLHERMPHAALSLETLCAWAVQWIRDGGRLLHKPTKFEVRDGRY